jgi:hypothetical protein
VKGDFTRDTFRARRHYWGVLRQQGRVDLDADWNEQIRIARHDQLRRTADLIGAAGGPQGSAGFELTLDDGDLLIGAGRYYVGGILCENDEDVDFDAQPELDPTADPPEDAGLHLAYLDVWDRHVTAHGDPVIREVALGGPDTATRVATAWQVRTASLGSPSPELTAAIAALIAARAADPADEAAEAAALQAIKALAEAALCATPLEPLGGSLEPGTGTMAAQADQDPDGASDPCRFEPQGGYRRLENRLYRVEVHDGGPRADATFKWSRDNGSLAFSIEEFVTGGGAPATTTRVRVRRLGFDAVRSLRRDDWVEIISDDDERAGRPGTLVQITNEPDAAERILELSDPVPISPLDRHPVVRRWDMPADGGLMDLRTTWQELEDGVQVRFAAGDFHPGDYWVIPARTNTADVEWPPYPTYPGETMPGAPSQLPPMGVERRRAPLAILVHDGATGLLAAIDQRRLFPTATAQTALFQLGGDGQEPELPDGRIPQPLQVGVANGEEPVEGVLVRFRALQAGDLLDAGGGGADVVIVPTDADGVASVEWTVDLDEVDHRVEVRLLDRCEEPTHLPVYFNARVDYALHYLSGDGQEGLEGDILPPLRVWVAHGRRPVEGATVAFTVEDGGGSLSAAEVATGPDGVAEVAWTLGGAGHRQQVRARLLDAPAGTPIHDAAVVFNANLSLASQVAYEPPDECEVLGETATVQEALDELCARISYSLQHLSGDGQEGLPGETLAPLRVWVADGRFPLEDATVAFTVTGGGSLSGAEVQTDADGVAEVEWTLGAGEARQQVEARLLDGPGGSPVHEASVRFNAFLSRADRIAYTPAEDCSTLVGTGTVQEALDELCRAGPAEEPGFRIREALVGAESSAVPLRNDSAVPADLLAQGLFLRCDSQPDPAALEGKPVWDVTLELPWPLSPSDMDFYAGSSDLIGSLPIILAGQVNAHDNVMEWIPERGPAQWMVQHLFPLLGRAERGDRVLTRLKVRGNVIWALDRPDVYLDGEAFGERGSRGRTELRLEEGSGDGRRGGDFEMWFWLTPPRDHPALHLEARSNRDSVFGHVFEEGGEPLPGATVTLTNLASGQAADAGTNERGLFHFGSVQQGEYEVRAQHTGFQPATARVTVTGVLIRSVDREFMAVSLRTVDAIGEATEETLTSAGILHPIQLATMDADELVERSGLTRNRAETLIANANLLFQ